MGTLQALSVQELGWQKHRTGIQCEGLLGAAVVAA